MKTIFLFVLAVLSLVYTNQATRFTSEEFINEINSMQSVWKAGKNFGNDVTEERIRAMLGLVKKSSDRDYKYVQHDDISDGDILDSFDARDQWPDCNSVKEIADQSSCGSCWAVAAASCMSDRICISSKSQNQPRISAKDIMSCCLFCGDGCRGGIPIDAWEYWTSNGFVTGGLYNTSVGCQPYPFETCEHHDAKGDHPKCPSDIYPTPACSSSCDTSEKFELTYGSDSYLIEGETNIQKEVLKNGPVVADFDVYDDFLTYQSGIYKYTKGSYLGGHAVRIIGWGVENDVKYWLVANSWNPDWGEKGLFRMIRGIDDCGFESECSGGIPKL